MIENFVGFEQSIIEKLKTSGLIDKFSEQAQFKG